MKGCGKKIIGQNGKYNREELQKLKEENKKLSELVEYFKSKGTITSCTKCNLPFKNSDNRIKVIMQMRTETGHILSDRQIGIFHSPCFKHECMVELKQQVGK